jgi:hypothetical protein
MKGAIKALFYRYAVSADNDNVSDFLIGARDRKTSFATHPGDSGTTWFIDPTPQASSRHAKRSRQKNGDGNANPAQDHGLQPMAVQWGGLLFADGSGTQESCALATCLSTVCNLLDVDVIRDWNIGGPDYWGETGHYTVGALSCLFDFKGLPRLQKLLRNNMDRIGFKPADLKVNEKVLRNKAHYAFVPLADVADDVWRTKRPSDANNHFADMDQKAPGGKFKGKDLLTLTLDPANIDPQVWADFYSSLPGTNPGALPFRVWQIYNEMVGFAKQGDALRFLAAAGILAHYVGDACQPLHVSRLHHGNPPVKKGTVAYSVHSVYETQMLNENVGDIVDGITTLVDGKSLSATFVSGRGAAARVIDLMRTTFTKLPPSKIVETYNSGTTPAARLSLLWQKHGASTITVMADGCRCLADIWASAWKEGGGEQITQSKLGAADEALLEQCYNDSGFLPSVALNTLVAVLAGGAAPPPAGAAGNKKKKKAKAKAKK